MKIRDMQTIARGFYALVGYSEDYHTFFTNKVSGETLPREEAKRRMEEWFINSWNDDDYDTISREHIEFDYDRLGGVAKIYLTTKNGNVFTVRIERPEVLRINGLKINLNN